MIDERIAIAKATAYYLEGENDKITKEGDVEIKPKLYAVMSGSPSSGKSRTGNFE